MKRRPAEEGLPTVEEMYNEETVNTKLKGHLSEKPENMTAFQIFYKFVVKNPNSWYLVGVDIFTYMVRFGMLTWIPLYLLKEKGLTKTDMGAAFMIFEWAAIPSTLIAGWLIDKFFPWKNYVFTNDLYDDCFLLCIRLHELRIYFCHYFILCNSWVFGLYSSIYGCSTSNGSYS